MMFHTPTVSAMDFHGIAATPFPRPPVQYGLDLVIYGGEGDCVQHYSGPAADTLRQEGCIARVACVDPRPAAGQIAYDDRFVNADGGLPLPQLEAAGYLQPRTVHLVSTPNHLHASIIRDLQAAGCTQIGTEKPLTTSSAEAEALLGLSVVPISHQLAKAEMLALIQAVQAGRLALDQIAHCTFALLETDGIPPDRVVDDVIFDMHWHGFEALVVPFALLVGPQGRVRVEIEQVQTATYADQPATVAPAGHWTVATIAGQLLCCDGVGRQYAIPYQIVAGKGLPVGKKQFVLQDGAGQSLHCVNLVERPRWQAHYRLLRELVTQLVPYTLTTLEQAVGVVTLCEQSVALAVDGGTYRFGSWPDFLA